jgi:adenylate cyclase
MGVEIERKFLVDNGKWQQVNKPAGTHYRQGYLSNNNNHTLRVRTTDKQGFITIKGATSGISRKEFEYQIPVEDGIELLDNFAVSEVEKIRYRIEFEGKLWEVDEFFGDNAGLITAEIELKHETEEFKQPGWIVREVSDDKRYYNSTLSVHPFNKW